MKLTLKRIASISFLLVIFIPNFTFAETKTFIREYTYQASDEDSKNSSRTVALREVKRLLLEELGTYLESETEVQNFQLTQDQITTLTAGVVQTELVEETWNGRTYWIKAKINADSGDVIKSIDALRKDREKTKELTEVRKRSDSLLKENDRLRRILITAKGKKKQKDTAAYNKTIKDLNATEWFEKGYALDESSNYTAAVIAYSKAIELAPQYASTYFNRGNTYINLDNYNQAIKDYDQAIVLNPQLVKAYGNRGNAYRALGDIKLAIQDYDKVIALDPKDEIAYNNRGVAYRNLGNYNQAIKDYDQAIKLNPQYDSPYYNRGNASSKLGDYNQAIKDYDQAIELNPQHANAYYSRAYSYAKLGNFKQADEDTKIAARLGNKVAQDFLTKNGIAW
jgi:tetratricopeptide (TPR) repeat protein